MQNAITKRLEQYILQETNYSVILNGAYGIGKTYYIKNVLFPYLKEIKIPDSNNDVRIIPIHISLFGVRSIEELKSQLFHNIYPILNKKGAKIASSILRTGLQYFGLDTEKMAESLENSILEGKEYDRFLICLDDIDRRSSDLKIEEVYGYINDLVENQGAKVLLVANENTLRGNDKNDETYYAQIREKVIGIALTYTADLYSAYDNIISKYSKVNQDYYEFLVKNKEDILSAIRNDNNNLRSLLFFLETFSVIYEDLTEIINAIPDEKKHEVILKEVCKFSLAIALEYKSGLLHEGNYNYIREIYSDDYIYLNDLVDNSNESAEDISENDQSFKAIFLKKYLKDTYTSDRRFYDSIFEYIIGFREFKSSDLAVEIRRYHTTHDDTIPEYENLFNTLSYHQSLDTPPNEYRKQINKMLQYMDQGKYSLEKVPLVFNLVTKYGNPLNYNIESLKIRFSKSIQNNEYQTTFLTGFFLLENSDHEFAEDLNYITKLCKERNADIEKERTFKELEENFNSKLENLELLINELCEPSSKFRLMPALSMINFNKFWKALLKTENSKIVFIGYKISRRYDIDQINYLAEEQDFISKFTLKVQKKLESKKLSKFNRIAYEELRTYLDSATKLLARVH